MNKYRIKSITSDSLEELSNNPNNFSELLNQNKGFIEQIVRKFCSKNPNYDFDDLFQEACIALWKSVNKYDPKRNGKSSFSTFAHTVIFNDVLQSIKRQNKVIKNENSIELYKNKKREEKNENNEYNESNFIPCYGKGISLEEEMIESIDKKNQMISLSENEKQIFKMKFKLKMKHKEIAKKLNLNIHTYKVIYYLSLIPKLKLLNK